MPHPIYRVARFAIAGPYTLTVVFTDGSTQEINFRPVLRGALFGPLRDLTLFNAVALDPEAGTLTWPNGADFDPATLHEWPIVCAELAARAQSWTESGSEPQANTRMEPTHR
jgi:hypothetical protein